MINDDDRIQKIAEMSFMFALLSHQIEGTYKFYSKLCFTKIKTQCSLLLKNKTVPSKLKLTIGILQ